LGVTRQIHIPRLDTEAGAHGRHPGASAARTAPKRVRAGSSARALESCESVEQLIQESLRASNYDRAFAVCLSRIALGVCGHRWDVRRAGALLLQRQLLLLGPVELSEHDFWFVRLGFKARLGFGVRLKREVLREGFHSREFHAFVGEWRRRLQRPAGLLVSGVTSTGANTLRRLAESECRLALGRYVFPPEDVATEVLRQMQVSTGELLPWGECESLIRRETLRARESLPTYEARILALLSDPTRIFWVGRQPATALNALVEYPLGTVVLTVKPPGSCFEFEIKRAGDPGPLPISAVFERNGYPVPAPHRLHAASMGWHLRYEARAGTRFRAIYRLIHGVVPNVALSHVLKLIHSVPTENGNRSLQDFFHAADLFGEDYAGMRIALRDSVREYFRADDLGVRFLPGELGQTFNFLMQTLPAQAVQSHTSSFRLANLATWLASDSPKPVFGGPLETEDPETASWLVDQMMEEVLGEYTPPQTPLGSYARHLDAAFARNRRRADEIFVQLNTELGTFWGTLVGIKGYSNGESFVSRNVGLRSVWQQGRWEVRLFFMDQDDLHIAETRDEDFAFGRILMGMTRDQNFIIGPSDGLEPNSATSALEQIYRVSPTTAATGREALREARTRALRKTTAALQTKIELRNHFNPTFLNRASECDRIWAAFRPQRERLLKDSGDLVAFILHHLPEAHEDTCRDLAQAMRAWPDHFLLNPYA